MKLLATFFTLLWVLATSAPAHELQDNRATLVLRDRQHMSLTLFVDYPKVLHFVLAPQSTLQEFLLVYSAMKPQEFQAQLVAAQRKLQEGTSLVMSHGKKAILMSWVWPDALIVQKLLQQRAMQTLVAPKDHAHTGLAEIRAEAKSSHVSDFKSVTLQLPAALQQVWVVSYQPKQVWLQPNSPSPVISF
jgi:hypothetical protein